jgi:hypothetical protein
MAVLRKIADSNVANEAALALLLDQDEDGVVRRFSQDESPSLGETVALHSRPIVDDLRELLRPQLRQTTLLLWAIWLLFGFGYYGTQLFLPRIFHSADSFNYPAIITSNLGGAVGVTCSIFLTRYAKFRCGQDNQGRGTSRPLGLKLVQVGFYATCCITTGLLAVNNTPTSLLTLWTFVAIGAMVGASNIAWTVTPQYYEDPAIRATGHGFANAFARVGAFLSPYFADSKRISRGSVLVGFAAVSGVLAVLAACLPKLPVEANSNSSHSNSDGTREKAEYVTELSCQPSGCCSAGAFKATEQG